MPRQFPSVSLTRPLLRWMGFLTAISMLGVLPRPLRADLFYKVDKAIKLTDSGLNPAADGSIPFSVTGLNSDGNFTGFFPSATANKLHAFLWNNTSKTFIDLNHLLAADSSMATCLNDAGTVSGVFWELGTYQEKGFLYYADGTVFTFAAVGTHAAISAVTAINASGSLIGTYDTGNAGTRGFLLQPGANPVATPTNLGTPGGSAIGYTLYVWPEALNDANQVVGDVFYWSNATAQVTATRGFFWNAPPMTLIDASTLSNHWKAIGLDGSGDVIGLYGLSNSANPFAVAGSFYWDGSALTDLPDLGGGGGVNVFAIRDSGSVFSTSLADDGLLHLALWPGRVSDYGSVSMYVGDHSFQPTGLSLTSVMDRYPCLGRLNIWISPVSAPMRLATRGRCSGTMTACTASSI